MYSMDSEEQQLQKCCTNDIAQFMYLHNYAKRSKIALEITFSSQWNARINPLFHLLFNIVIRDLCTFQILVLSHSSKQWMIKFVVLQIVITKNHGSNIIAVASEIVKADSSLPKLFKNTLGGKIDFMDGSMVESISAVYSEFTRKLYNTRLAEFIDSYRQKQAAEKVSASLSGQNLRDSLLSQHANLKSTDIH